MVRATAGPRVVRCVEYSVGTDQVRRATGTESTQVPGAAITGQVKMASRGGSERHQVAAGHRRVAAVVAGVAPGLSQPGQGVPPPPLVFRFFSSKEPLPLSGGWVGWAGRAGRAGWLAKGWLSIWIGNLDFFATWPILT